MKIFCKRFTKKEMIHLNRQEKTKQGIEKKLLPKEFFVH